MHEQLPLADCVQQNEHDCRKISSEKSSFIAVEHNKMKDYKYSTFISYTCSSYSSIYCTNCITLKDDIGSYIG
jgi:hypothetical protein